MRVKSPAFLCVICVMVLSCSGSSDSDFPDEKATSRHSDIDVDGDDESATDRDVDSNDDDKTDGGVDTAVASEVDSSSGIDTDSEVVSEFEEDSGTDSDSEFEYSDDTADEYDTLVLDVRTGSEYDSGHCPDAINVPLSELSSNLNELGDRNRHIVVYCQSGNRSRQAASILVDAGFTDVEDAGAISSFCLGNE